MYTPIYIYIYIITYNTYRHVLYFRFRCSLYMCDCCCSVCLLSAASASVFGVMSLIVGLGDLCVCCIIVVLLFQQPLPRCFVMSFMFGLGYVGFVVIAVCMLLSSSFCLGRDTPGSDGERALLLGG